MLNSCANKSTTRKSKHYTSKTHKLLTVEKYMYNNQLSGLLTLLTVYNKHIELEK